MSDTAQRDHSILELIASNGRHVATRVAQAQGVSRQSASSWLQQLKHVGLISVSGHGPGLRYQLVIETTLREQLPRSNLREDRVWAQYFAPAMSQLADNVRDIWHYAITEMINNAIDHSNAATVSFGIGRDALNTYAYVADDGEGIFLKIQHALNLFDPREAILELAKGKLTTDPANHSGEGIFFSSKVMDKFDIRSGRLHFMHGSGLDDWLLERPADATGTLVLMQLANNSTRTSKQIFDFFAAPDEYSFAKTIVPVELAQYEGEKLMSRSQAKRVVQRIERFKTVILDFNRVAEIGQAFADEIFRVFQNAHPQIHLVPINMTSAVENMITRAQHLSTDRVLR